MVLAGLVLGLGAIFAGRLKVLNGLAYGLEHWFCWAFRDFFHEAHPPPLSLKIA